MKPEDFRDEIEAAAERITPYIRRTPTISLAAGDLGLDFPVTLKLECLQHTGSFKARGAFNRLLASDVPAAGVNAASGGNHGIAVAYAARELGYQADIFVPEISSPVKIARLRDYGAQVNIVGQNYAEALAASEARVATTGALVVHAYDQTEAVAGQGTTARELEEQEGTFDTILVA
ncbi:MAG: pyridoxal-phosphate dependent enzyme, partial [Rickettsiales bacterium]